MPLNSQGFIIPGVGIRFWDMGTRESFKNFGRSVATRTILTLWNDRIKLINALFAQSGLNVSQQFQFIQAPSYPDAPKLLYFEQMDTEQTFGTPEGVSLPQPQLYEGPNGVVASPYATIKLIYASRPWDQNSWSVTNMDFGFEDLPLAPGTYQFSTTGNSADHAKSTQRILTGTIEVTSFNQPIITTTTWLGLVNKTNSVACMGFDPGTLLLYPPKTHSRTAISGVTNWDQSWNFHWNPMGWNKAVNPLTGFFEAVKTVNGSNPPNPSADLNQLFGGIGGPVFQPPQFTFNLLPLIPGGGF